MTAIQAVSYTGPVRHNSSPGGAHPGRQRQVAQGRLCLHPDDARAVPVSAAVQHNHVITRTPCLWGHRSRRTNKVICFGTSRAKVVGIVEIHTRRPYVHPAVEIRSPPMEAEVGVNHTSAASGWRHQKAAGRWWPHGGDLLSTVVSGSHFPENASA